MGRFASLGNRLYTGEVSVDFVGRRRTWYLISAVVIAVAIAAVAVRGLNFSIEFRGGVDFRATVPADRGSAVEAIPDVRAAVADVVPADSEPIVTAIGGDQVSVETAPLGVQETSQVRDAISTELGIRPAAVNYSNIGPTWGEQITERAITGLVVFLGLVMVVIWLYFREWRMSISAIAALAHDVIITVGIYALIGFAVTPATIIGVLTILGYSLYDTVVVFDKVRENTNGIAATSRQTYSEAANLAVNQTLVRSINTSVIALLPVGGILFVGAGLLGAGTLKDLALALFIGIGAGTYSSVFIATPLLCAVKEREPAMRSLRKRVEHRRASAAKAEAAARAEASAKSRPKSTAERADAATDTDQPSEAESGEPVGVGAGDSARSRAASPAQGRTQPQRRPRSSRRSRGKR